MYSTRSPRFIVLQNIRMEEQLKARHYISFFSSAAQFWEFWLFCFYNIQTSHPKYTRVHYILSICISRFQLQYILLDENVINVAFSTNWITFDETLKLINGKKKKKKKNIYIYIYIYIYTHTQLYCFFSGCWQYFDLWSDKKRNTKTFNSNVNTIKHFEPGFKISV